MVFGAIWTSATVPVGPIEHLIGDSNMRRAACILGWKGPQPGKTLGSKGRKLVE